MVIHPKENAPMIQRHLLLVLFLFSIVFSSTMAAQSPCPSEDLSAIPGVWQTWPGASEKATHAARPGSYDGAAAEATLNRVLGLIKETYPQPMGGNTMVYRNLTFTSPEPQRVFGYRLTVGHTHFYCTMANAVVEGVETGTFINVDVNSFGTLVSRVGAPEINTFGGDLKLHGDELGNYLIDGKPVYHLPIIAGEHRGVDYYTNHRYSKPGEIPAEEWVLFRRSDVPPFTYVTRGEYIRQFRDELATYKVRQIEGDREFAKLSGDTDAPERIAAFERTMDAYLKAIDDYLADESEDELNRPVSELLSLFPRDPDQPEITFREGDFHLVYLNPDHLDPTLPHHVPQFIVLQLGVRGADTRFPYRRQFRERIMNGLDFEAMRALIAR